MISFENPLKKQQKIEREHEEELLVLIGFLFLMLKKAKPLTPGKVILAIQEWKVKYWPQVYEVNGEAVTKVKKLADSLMQAGNASIRPTGAIGRLAENLQNKITSISTVSQIAQSSEIRRHTSASSSLLESVIVAVEQKYKDLAVMVENYNANANQIKENIEEIVKTTETSIGRFVRLCEARNLINFIFESAIEKGYTEYRWQTEQDDRVRPTHAAVNKKWFKIGDPPKETGYYQPMEDWGCRCYPSEFR